MGVRLGYLDQRSHGSQDPEYSIIRAQRSLSEEWRELTEGCLPNPKYLNPPSLGVDYLFGFCLFIILPDMLMRETNEYSKYFRSVIAISLVEILQLRFHLRKRDRCFQEKLRPEHEFFFFEYLQ